MKTLILLFGIILFSGCKPETNSLPVLSYKVNADGEKEIYSINYSGFTNQNGEEITNKTFENKVVIANFFFTTCPSICPPMRTELIKIAHEFKEDDEVLLISHTIDPKNDTTEVLKNYSESTEVNIDKWLFARSDTENTKSLAKQLMTNFRPYEDGTDFYHSSYATLIDKDQKIRGFYNVLVTEDVKRLIEDIKLLIK